MLRKYLKSFNPFRKGEKLYSIIRLKCPRCQEGNLFITQNPYNLKKFDKMYHKCLVCEEDFDRETGFYYGAMMVSHAVTFISAAILFFVFFYIGGWDMMIPFLITNGVIIILFAPMTFRYSRAAWINFFVGYDSKYNNK